MVNNNVEQYIQGPELEVYNKVLKNPSISLSDEERLNYKNAVQKLSQATQQLLRQYYKIPNHWSTVRAYSKPIGNFTPSINSNSYSGYSPSITIRKSGGTLDNETRIRLQNLKNRSKDVDNFHKNLNKQKDRHEKSLDRVAKYSKRNKK